MKYFFNLTIVLLLFSSQLIFCQNKDSIKTSKSPFLENKFSSFIGVFLPSKTLKIGVNGKGSNEIIDFGKSFDINRQEATLALSFYWRFSRNQKWSVGLEYFSVNDSGQKNIEKEIHWGDIIYPIGANLEIGLGLNLYRLFFGRVISRGDKHELIAGLGIHALDIDSYAQAYGNIGGIEQNGSIDLSKNLVYIVAPVPNIGIKYWYSLNSKWVASFRADYFSLNIKDFSGYLWNLAPGVSYQLFKSIGIGINYRYFNTTLNFNKKSWKGSVGLLYHGPLISLTASF